MRGHDTQQAGMHSYLSPEERVAVTHPLRPPIRQYVDTALIALLPQLTKMYSHTGQPSIAAEKLLRPLLPQSYGGRDHPFSSRWPNRSCVASRLYII